MIEERLYKLIKRATRKNEVPIAALIIKNNKIIAEAINDRERKNNVLGHAEINAVKKATKKLKTWKLDDCILYSTVKPCNMCYEIIKNARIKKVYYYLENTKEINKICELQKVEKIDNQKFKNEIKNFFKTIRKK